MYSSDLDTSNDLKMCTVEKMETEFNSHNVSIYPTISHGVVNIDISSNNHSSEFYVLVFDMLGNKMLSQPLHGDNPCNVNISNCPNGVYIVQVIDKQGDFLKTEKIVVSR